MTWGFSVESLLGPRQTIPSSSPAGPTFDRSVELGRYTGKSVVADLERVPIVKFRSEELTSLSQDVKKLHDQASVERVMMFATESPYRDDIKKYLESQASVSEELSRAMPYLSALEDVVSVKLEFAQWDEYQPLTIWVKVNDLEASDDLQTQIYEWWYGEDTHLDEHAVLAVV